MCQTCPRQKATERDCRQSLQVACGNLQPVDAHAERRFLLQYFLLQERNGWPEAPTRQAPDRADKTVVTAVNTGRTGTEKVRKLITGGLHVNSF